MPVVVRRPGPPLRVLVQAIVYRAGQQPQTSVEKILPGPETSLWVNLNRDAFRSFDDDGQVRRVPGAMLAGPTSRTSPVSSGPSRASPRGSSCDPASTDPTTCGLRRTGKPACEA